MKNDILNSRIYNDEISIEQKSNLLNESTDKVNLSSLLFLQTKQRRIDHRRNKSEPVIRASLEDLSLLNSQVNPILESSSTSTTSNESAISSNTSSEKKRKSSKIKNNSPLINDKQIQDKSSSISSSATKKKKPWYNVSLLFSYSIYLCVNNIILPPPHSYSQSYIYRLYKNISLL